MTRVFISHRGLDTALATRLATDLARKGNYQIWLDVWQIDIGDSIVGRINEGLTGDVAVILCLSSLTDNSAWMDAEWMSALARKLNGENVKLLPVRITGKAVPPILSDIKYADLMSDWDSGIDAIHKALVKISRKV